MFEIHDTNGRVLAEGIGSWSAAARLADHYTRRFRVLATVRPVTVELRTIFYRPSDGAQSGDLSRMVTL